VRTTLTDWNDETLWQTYALPTDLESLFRSLKSELGPRPVYHHKEKHQIEISPYPGGLQRVRI